MLLLSRVVIHSDKNVCLLCFSVIAVTGLGGHAFYSFKSSQGWEVWLRDFLPSDIPDVRVLLYGYNTKVAKSELKNSIADLAKSLLELVKSFREETEVRTIYFHNKSITYVRIDESPTHHIRWPQSWGITDQRGRATLSRFGSDAWTELPYPSRH